MDNKFKIRVLKAQKTKLLNKQYKTLEEFKEIQQQLKEIEIQLKELYNE